MRNGPSRGGEEKKEKKSLGVRPRQKKRQIGVSIAGRGGKEKGRTEADPDRFFGKKKEKPESSVKKRGEKRKKRGDSPLGGKKKERGGDH